MMLWCIVVLQVLTLGVLGKLEQSVSPPPPPAVDDSLPADHIDRFWRAGAWIRQGVTASYLIVLNEEQALLVPDKTIGPLVRRYDKLDFEKQPWAFDRRSPIQ